MSVKSVTLVNFSEYAKKWGIARGSVWRMIREGRLRVYRINGKRRLDPTVKPPLLRKRKKIKQ